MDTVKNHTYSNNNQQEMPSGKGRIYLRNYEKIEYTKLIKHLVDNIKSANYNINNKGIYNQVQLHDIHESAKIDAIEVISFFVKILRDDPSFKMCWKRNITEESVYN